jgi:hypothetical protein
MSIDQPEASTSTSTPPLKHHVSLVIDSALAREQYLRLVEANGVVHSLVQRLMEKHGGDKHVGLPLRQLEHLLTDVATLQCAGDTGRFSAE